MTNEEIRIKVAEAMGWKRVEFYEWVNGVRTPKQWADFDVLPNYPKDLDACAEFEKTLTDDELWAYSKLLMDYRQVASGFPLASRSEVVRLKKSTPRECCLAYLKTKGIIQ